VNAKSLLTAESELLLLAIAPEPGDDALRVAIQRPDLDWDRLIWLAEKEKATAVLWNALRRVVEAGIPPDRSLQLSRLAAISDFRMLHYQRRLGEALAILSRHGIEVVLLKGAGLGTTVYKSFVERPMYDLDLLIRGEQGVAAWNALRQAGWTHDDGACPTDFYHDHHHLPPLDDPSGTGLSIELHTAPWAGAVELSTEAIWKTARPLEVAGVKAYTLSVNHQILQLAIHFAWAHLLQSAAWRTIRDLRQVVATGPVDWEGLVRTAREARAATCCYWTFSLARTLAGVPIPDSVLEALRPPLAALALRGLERHFIGALFDLGHARCPSLRLRRFLWAAAILPGSLRGESLRPWSRDSQWPAPPTTATAPSLRVSLRNHAARLPAWAGYLGAVLWGRVAAAAPPFRR
jgi:hypothetical protein